MPIDCDDPRLSRLARAYEQLRRDNLDCLLSLYGAQARFKDPFNDVQGREAIARVFVHMFDTLSEPRFTILHGASAGEQGFLTWELHFRRANGQMLQVRGASHLRFAGDGLVQLHRDYWDAAEELYAKIAVLGPVMRWLQRRLAAPLDG